MTLRTLALLLASLAILSGCARVSESRFNPFNWFGNSETETVQAETVEVADPRPLVAQVTALTIERTPTGAIVRATGLPPQQGWYGAALVRDSDEPIDGVMTYRFRAFPPKENTRVSTVQSRELSVAASLSNVTLSRTRVVRVIGAQNTRIARR